MSPFLPHTSPPSLGYLICIYFSKFHLLILMYNSHVSNFEQYELIFCVESNCDPVIALVDNLMRKHPQVESKLFIGE